VALTPESYAVGRHNWALDHRKIALQAQLGDDDGSGTLHRIGVRPAGMAAQTCRPERVRRMARCGYGFADGASGSGSAQAGGGASISRSAPVRGCGKAIRQA
jgi:hypothetical protein